MPAVSTDSQYARRSSNHRHSSAQNASTYTGSSVFCIDAGVYGIYGKSHGMSCDVDDAERAAAHAAAFPTTSVAALCVRCAARFASGILISPRAQSRTAVSAARGRSSLGYASVKRGSNNLSAVKSTEYEYFAIQTSNPVGKWLEMQQGVGKLLFFHGLRTLWRRDRSW